MRLTIKGKHLDVGDALRQHVEENLGHTAQKYFRDPIDATVIFTKEKGHRYRADISIHVGHGIVLQSEHEADDPYPAFDVAAQRVGTRLGRYKDKIRDHHRKEDPVDMHIAAYTTFKDEAEGGSEPAVIAEMETKMLTLAVADAVMRLDLSGVPAMMFKNPANGCYNMVYRRKDGNIGWVDPEGTKKKAVKTTTVKTVTKKESAQKEAVKKTKKK